MEILVLYSNDEKVINKGMLQCKTQKLGQTRLSLSYNSYPHCAYIVHACTCANKHVHAHARQSPWQRCLQVTNSDSVEEKF